MRKDNVVYITNHKNYKGKNSFSTQRIINIMKYLMATGPGDYTMLKQEYKRIADRSRIHNGKGWY